MWTERTGATRGWMAQQQTPAAEEQTGDGAVTASRQTERRSGTHTYTNTPWNFNVCFFKVGDSVIQVFWGT